MGFTLNSLALETTRRCNIRCKHCMRGKSQNINLTKEIIDRLLNNLDIDVIEEICFSGGEPTLNPEIIIYTINKIIAEEKNVHHIAMVTNGQIFVKEIVDAFNRFNYYRNQKIREKIIKEHKDSTLFDKNATASMIELNTNNHARITFSTDEYHLDIKNEIKLAYQEYARGLEITEYSVKKDEVYKTGFADFGKDFNYQLKDIRYYKNLGGYYILDILYVTANGYLTSEGMGRYTDMDCINMGHISENDIRDILIKYGNPVFDTDRIRKEANVLVKK